METEISAPSLVLPTRDQRFENRLIGVEAGGNIDDRHADTRRRIGTACHRRHAGFGLNQQVVGLALSVRAALAIAGDRAADQSRILFAQAGQRKAELRQRTGLEVLHEHVGLREHRFEHSLVFGLAEIEHHRLLAAIEPDEIGALAVHDMIIVTGEIAFRPLDLDHARAGIGETAGTLRRRHRLLDRNDEKTGERKHGHSSPLAGRGRFPSEAGTG